MNKLQVLDDLLPGFQQFLNDLTTCRLSSALEVQVQRYNQNIEDYIAQNYSMPTSCPPDPPTATNGVEKNNTEDFIAEQRKLSRLSKPSMSKDDSYYNVQLGTSQATDVSNASVGFDNFYEPPTKSPPVPMTQRPPIRVIQDDPEFYEEPDDIPVKPQGKSATMPLPSKQTMVEKEGSDSGGTFISFHSTCSSSSQPQDELQEYEDLPDLGNFDDGDESWSSTDYESYDEDEVVKEKPRNTDSNANKTKHKADGKSKTDKLALFKNQYKDDPTVDHLGLLYTPKIGMTISKKTLGPWDKRYCLAKDMHLLGYKNYDSKRTTIDLVLFGNTVAYVGQDGRRQNVFSISHPNRSTEMYSAETKEDTDRWIEVLTGYATMGNELVPSTGYVEKEGLGTPTHTGDEITKKLINFFKRDRKTKEMAPQLSIDDKGVLSGYINVFGGKYSDTKWRKKFVTIQHGIMECYSEDGDTLQFEFPLNGTDMMPADQKITKRKVSMKICRDNEPLIYVETFNHLDMGPFLKKYAEEMVPDPKKDLTSPKQRGMVSSILRAFEKQNSDSGDQGTENGVEVYDDIQIAASKDSKDSSRKNAPSSIYTNIRIVMQHAGRRKSTPSSPKLLKKADEEAATTDSSKKDKKTKKEKEKKAKKEKKSKGKEEVVAKEEEVAAKGPEAAAAVNAHEPVQKRTSVNRPNKFKESDKSHLLNVDRLETERKDVDERKRVVTKRKIDLRSQKRETTDPKMKELLDAKLQKAQQEWSECSNRLAFINNEIERFTKGGDTGMKIEQKQDTASAEIIRNGISEKTKNEPAGSPGREVAKRSVGNVQDKLKMFQGMGNK